MESHASPRLIAVDEDTPITVPGADDYLERLPWLPDAERRAVEGRGASQVLLWPITGAVLVALLSYFAAQASFAEGGQAQLTITLPPPTLHDADRRISSTDGLSREAQARYLAQVAHELQELQSSDGPAPRSPHASGHLK